MLLDGFAHLLGGQLRELGVVEYRLDLAARQPQLRFQRGHLRPQLVDLAHLLAAIELVVTVCRALHTLSSSRTFAQQIGQQL